MAEDVDLNEWLEGTKKNCFAIPGPSLNDYIEEAKERSREIRERMRKEDGIHGRLECLKLTVAMFIASAARGETRQLQAETDMLVKFVQTGEWE